MTTPTDREAMRSLRELAASPPPRPGERFDGRGVVVCAGGTRMLTCAWVCLSVLRRTLDCRLPVQLWHLGPEELGPDEASLFAELDVETVDALEVRREHPARILGGWELKPYALVHSRFREALLLDADNVAVVDPSFLFDTEQFATTGALFWPGIDRIGRDNRLWELCGVPYRNEPAWESGQVVVDKERCWHALRLTLHMNMHSDVFYAHSHGDKDTFHMAWAMLEQPYAMTRHPPKPVPAGLFQRDFDGRTLFQHRSAAKWELHGQNPRCPGFRYEDDCLEYLRDLASRWSGRGGPGVETRLPPQLPAPPLGGPTGPPALVLAALLDRLALGRIDDEDAVTTIATVGEIADLTEALARERDRWRRDPRVVRVLERAEARLGRRDPSLRPHGPDHGQAYERLA